MKNIKFRAWDKREKRIFNVTEIEFSFNNEIFNEIKEVKLDGKWGKCCGLDRYGQKECFTWWGEYRDGKDCELIQFTGLTDDNGKEIFEGDIVDITVDGFPKLIGSVIWDKLFAGFQIWDGEDEFDIKKNVKVIGNIYENPELLNS